MAAVNARYDGRAIAATAAPIAALGVIGTAIALAVDPDRALAAYLVAWTWLVTIGIGALGVLLIGHAANVRWIAVVRRLVETVAQLVVPCAILFVPLAIGARHVWPWVDPPPSLAKELAPRAAWLSLTPFVIRAFVYLSIFAIAVVVLCRRSRARDERAGTLDADRAFASVMLPLVGLAASLAGFDWLMSLAPTWWSSAFGLYVITGALVAGLAATIVLAARDPALPLTRNHFHALGRLLLAFTMLWGYIAYFQAFLIRIANRPDEVTFYVARLAGGWRWVTYLLIVLHLALPLPLLVPRIFKLRRKALAAIALVLLAAHWLDLFWIVVPAAGGPLPSWIDLAAIFAVAGSAGCALAWRLHGVPRVAVGDPHLPAALHYASPT